MALNFNRLRYFWMVGREGTLRRSAERLHISEPAVSTQLKKLQAWMGAPLFRKEGRRLVLTELGQVVYEYADEIFALGQELTDVVRGRTESRSLRMRVGITETLPKLLVEQLLAPAFDLGTFRIEVREAPVRRLMADLALHELDLALSDEAVASDPAMRVFSHPLGRCEVSVLGTPALRESLGADPMARIGDAPWLLPAEGAPIRRDLDRWFATEEIRPRVIGEFQDSALLKAFGGEGRGLVAVPAAVEAKVCDQHGLEPILRLSGIEESFYALTAERRISHPGIEAVLSAAAAATFPTTSSQEREASGDDPSGTADPSA